MTAVVDRPYRATDHEAVRVLLAEGYRRRGRWLTWGLERWAQFRLGMECEREAGVPCREDDIRVWEAGHEVVGVVHPERRDEAWLEIHPDHGSLAPAMLDWARAHHAERVRAGTVRRGLATFAWQADQERATILAEHGFVLDGPVEVLRMRPLDRPVEPVAPPHGYRVRWLDQGDRDELDRMAAVTNLIFPHAELTGDVVAREYAMSVPRATIVAVADDGSFAAWCGVNLDRGVLCGWFEPVGTHPDHRRRGLARAVMSDGLRWFREQGAREAYVGTGAVAAANDLYEGLGLAVAERIDRWRPARP